MKMPNRVVDHIAEEFGSADLGDRRRTQRLARVVGKLAKRPGASLPAALGSDAEIQAAYRLMNNEDVSFGAVLEPHVQAAAARAREVREVLVLHDTTDCSFPTLDPAEIGFLQTGKAGFPLHLSVAVDGDTWRRPLGVLNAEPLFRPRRSRTNWRRKPSGTKTGAQTDKEFERWWRGMSSSAKELLGHPSVIHIADRESDSYDLMARALVAGYRFVFRVRVDRRGREAEAREDGWSSVWKLAKACEGVFERQVTLSRRKATGMPAADKAHPPRKMRLAKLSFAARRVVIPRPQYLRDPVARELALNLVHVCEIDPPEGEAPVEWLLYTTEPIDTPERVADVVDKYRTRWVIEEFNAALKTGCAYEERQFESRQGLLIMLAISLPIACELLWLRSRARTDPRSPATEVISPVQLQVLRVLGNRKLPTEPTAEDALLAVAALGGHLKRNGPPGWKVLHRGMLELIAYETGWRAALASSPVQEM
jgi:hypothetical protein